MFWWTAEYYSICVNFHNDCTDMLNEIGERKLGFNKFLSNELCIWPVKIWPSSEIGQIIQ